jgi:hypothetical protein
MMYCFEPGDEKYTKEKPDLSKRVSVEGAISGIGDPTRIRIRFTQETFDDEAGSFVADMDGGLYVGKPGPGLESFGTGKGPRTLIYLYCCASSHGQSDYCDNSEHDPLYYKFLRIYGGTLESKGGETQVVWPTGSPCSILSKDKLATVARGELAAAVLYKEN